MSRKFTILGAGMQGTAAAYDLAQFGDPDRIVLADTHLNQAAASAGRVNSLVGRAVCEPFAVNALDEGALASLFQSTDVVLSCVPYWMHPKIAPIAIQTNTHMVDLGGNTDVTWQTLALNELAVEAGVTLIPDTGLAPGLVNSIGIYLVDCFDAATSVQLYCGVLPQNPVPPLNYKLTFNVEGLVTEYDFQAISLRDGEIVLVDTLAEIETLELEGLGTMEAFTTSGGTSTAPYTLQGRVRDYAYKTIRFPGHCERVRLFKDFGFWDPQPVEVKGQSVSPLDVFCKVFGDRLKQIEDSDQCIVRGVGIGSRGGKKLRVQVDLHDLQDPHTGFTAMERTTGFSISIHAIALANGEFPPGALRYENAMSGEQFIKKIRKRGLVVNVAETELDS